MNTRTKKRMSVGFVIGMLLVVGCQGAGTTPTDSATFHEVSTGPGTDPSAMEAAEWSFVVKDGKVEGPSSVEVQAGQMAHLTVTSDQDGEIHVHGYEVMQDILAGETKTVMVQADAPGIFEVALHPDPEIPITELSVTP